MTVKKETYLMIRGNNYVQQYTDEIIQVNTWSYDEDDKYTIYVHCRKIYNVFVRALEQIEKRDCIVCFAASGK